MIPDAVAARARLNSWCDLRSPFFINHDTIGVLHAADGFVMPGVTTAREDLLPALLVAMTRVARGHTES